MLRPKSKIGKYVIERKLGEGGFAVVYQARDTIEGIRVALKMPYAHMVDDTTLDTFRHEVRIAAKLEHPNILPLKCADFVDGQFVIVTALGTTTLEARLGKRLAADRALDFARQMLSAVSYAHQHHVIHCDLKPENMLIFPGNHIRLMDFGIARVAQKTLKGSGAGTVGYIAPEQAMGKPSFRSDVFSLGIILYRMFAGVIPEWPLNWPPPRHGKLKERLHPEFVALIKKSIDVEARRRFRNATAMQEALKRIRSPLRGKASQNGRVGTSRSASSWEEVRRREFKRTYGKQLEAIHICTFCAGPVSEVMQACPWCGKQRKKHTGEKARFSSVCPRCSRGLKADWRYCPWCFGPGFEQTVTRNLTDRRYTTRCRNPQCDRKDLMPFMRYCPWCRRRVRKSWKIEGNPAQCHHCGDGVLPYYWTFCPWCAKRIDK